MIMCKGQYRLYKLANFNLIMNGSSQCEGHYRPTKSVNDALLPKNAWVICVPKSVQKVNDVVLFSLDQLICVTMSV